MWWHILIIQYLGGSGRKIRVQGQLLVTGSFTVNLLPQNEGNKHRVAKQSKNKYHKEISQQALAIWWNTTDIFELLFLSPKFPTVYYFYSFCNQTYIKKMPSGGELSSLHCLRCLVAVLKYFHQKQLFQGTQKWSHSLSKIKNLVKPFLCGINSSLSKVSCLQKQQKEGKINGLLPFHTKWRVSYNFSSH